jgi:hypothetical protein
MVNSLRSVKNAAMSAGNCVVFLCRIFARIVTGASLRMTGNLVTFARFAIHRVLRVVVNSAYT